MKRREFITLVGWLRGSCVAARRYGSAEGKAPPYRRIESRLDRHARNRRVLRRAAAARLRRGFEHSDRATLRRLEYGSIPAADLVRLKVDVIIVISTSPARAAKQATNIIPIVVGGMADPVGDELIVSLSRPGGNITGTTFLGPELIAKRFGLLKEAISGLSRVAALWHPAAYGKRTMEGMLRETETAAQSLGLQLHLVPAVGPDDLDSAFVRMTREHVDAVILLPSPMLYGEHKHIVELAAKSRLPAMYAAREFVEDGGLMSYGASLPNLFRRAATYVDKILKGVNPADLPVEQPTKLELVINLKPAKALGLNVPATLLAQADEVIE
jgi:putative ABC transport system substrate-binding protein